MTNDDDFESGLNGGRAPTENPQERAVKKGLHVLTHFIPEKNLGPKAMQYARDYKDLADRLATDLPAGNVLTSALERLLDSRNMVIQRMGNK